MEWGGGVCAWRGACACAPAICLAPPPPHPNPPHSYLEGKEEGDKAIWDLQLTAKLLTDVGPDAVTITCTKVPRRAEMVITAEGEDDGLRIAGTTKPQGLAGACGVCGWGGSALGRQWSPHWLPVTQGRWPAVSSDGQDPRGTMRGFAVPAQHACTLARVPTLHPIPPSPPLSRRYRQRCP